MTTSEKFFTPEVFVSDIEFAELASDVTKEPMRAGIRMWMPPRVINSFAALTIAGVLTLPVTLSAAVSRADAASWVHFARKAGAPPIVGATLNDEQQARVARFRKFFSSAPQSKVEQRLDVDYGF